MLTNIKRFFCKHNYIKIGHTVISDNSEPIIFYMCDKCFKRKVYFDGFTRSKTSSWYKDLVKLWCSYEYELKEDDVTSYLITPDKLHLENCWRSSNGM